MADKVQVRLTPVRHGRLINSQHVAPGQIVVVDREDAHYLLGAEVCRECAAEEASVDPADDSSCTACGAILAGGSMFCNRCGATVGTKPAPAGAPVAQNGDKTPQGRR